MFRITVLALLAIAAPSWACSFCGGMPLSRSTLREDWQAAKAVAFGILKNPQLAGNAQSGTTEFHVASVAKPDPALVKNGVVTIPNYLLDSSAVTFFAAPNGKLDPVRTLASDATLEAYLGGIAKLPANDVPARLAFAFKHLDSPNETVADDAFLEFAKATDAELSLAKPYIDPTRLKLMLKNPKTPPARLGVYALLLGSCGTAADAPVLTGLLAESKSGGPLGGLLAGLALLDAKAGWQAIGMVLGDGKRDFGERLAARSAIQYLQANAGEAHRKAILAVYSAALADRDLADLAMDDLRRWKWWDATDTVLGLWNREGFAAPIMRKAVLRYALQCPNESAQRFVVQVRSTDPKLVASVEERLKMEK